MLHIAGVSSITLSLSHIDTPNCDIPDKNVAKEEKREWLLNFCLAFVKKNVLEHEGIQPLVEQVQELETCGQNRFPCRADPDCNKTYAFHSGRVK